jgi:hypothetical protein
VWHGQSGSIEAESTRVLSMVCKHQTKDRSFLNQTLTQLNEEGLDVRTVLSEEQCLVEPHHPH